MVFSKRNYLLLLAGVAVVIAGYVMMRMENEVDGFISLYVAPLLILGGYIQVMFAIFARDKDEKREASAAAANEGTSAPVQS